MPDRFFAGKILNRIDPWRGIPTFLKNHGYDARVLLGPSPVPSTDSKIHLIAADQTARDALMTATAHPERFASLTLVDPDFSLELQSFDAFAPPKGIMIGTLLSSKNGDFRSRMSQRVAKSWGPSFSIFEGTPDQLVGHLFRGRPFYGPRVETAHEFFLRHCIFLAECDLTTAQ